MTTSRPRWLPRPGWLLIVPAALLLGGTLGMPLWQSFWRSVHTVVPVGEPGTAQLTLEHYRALFTDGVTLRVLARTGKAAAIVTVVALLLGYPYAYLMTRVGARARSVLVVLVLMPFWTSALARNFGWLVLLYDGGLVQRFLGLFGLGDVVLYGTATGVTLAMSQVLLPYMVLPLYSSLGGIDRRLLLAARSLGSPPLVAFWKVYWPLSRGGVAAGMILVFTLACGFYVTPALIGSPRESLVAQLLGQRTTQLLDFAGAGALGTLVLVVTLVLVAWANRVGGSMATIGAGFAGQTRSAR
ncbi:ABC transporter permease [Dactylosporangium sp. NPDC005572]|uniref:ABC transporter permease n=1 Tax=Dactylosporangium sp. NPDC005572 TaxID=3156889 RepID=UPI0033A050F0